MTTAHRRKALLPLALTALALVPAIALAKDCGQGTTGIPNPTNFCSLAELFVGVLKLFLGALGLFGTVMFMWGGFLMLTSGGQADRVQKGKDTLFWSTIGIAVAIGSWMIIQTILRVTSQATF